MLSYRKIYRWIAPAIIFITLLALTSTVFAQSPTPVLVRLVPRQGQVAVGQLIDLAVEVVDVTDLYAIDVLLSFDPQALEVVDQDPELDGVQVQLGTLLEPGFVILNLVDNSLGRLRLAMTQLNPATPKSGTGTIVVVRFRARAASPASAVAVLEAEFSSPNGVEIPVSGLESARVEIVQSLAGPTSTSIPAQDPGTPMPTQAAPTSSGQQQPQPTFPAPPTPDYLSIQPTATNLPPPPATQTQAQSAAASPTPELPATSTGQPSNLPTSTGQPAVTPVALQESAAAASPASTESASGPQKAAGLTPTAEMADQAIDETGSSQASTSPAWIILLLGVLAAGAVLAIAGLAVYLLMRRKRPKEDSE